MDHHTSLQFIAQLKLRDFRRISLRVTVSLAHYTSLFPPISLSLSFLIFSRATPALKRIQSRLRLADDKQLKRNTRIAMSHRFLLLCIILEGSELSIRHLCSSM